VLWPLVLVARDGGGSRAGGAPRTRWGWPPWWVRWPAPRWLTVLSHRLVDADLSRAYVGTDTRVLAPLVGCALAAWSVRFPRAAARRAPGVASGLLGAGVLAAMWVLVDVTDPALYRQGGFVVAALAAAALVHGAAQATTTDRHPVGWASTRGWARYLGTRSYGIYLWSWPLQVLLVFRWRDLSDGALAAATVLGTLVLAELSHRFVEAPLRHRVAWAERPAARRPAWVVGMVGAFGVVALSLATAGEPPLHERIDTAQAAADALRPVAPPATEPPTDPAGSPGPPPPPEAPEEIDAGPLRVMLAGDSVAWTVGYYAPTGDDLPEGIESIDSRAIIGCGLLSSEGWEYRVEGVFRSAPEACREQPEAEKLGLAGSPDVVMMLPGAWEWGDMRSPDGQFFGARSPELAEVLTDRMFQRVTAAHEAGAQVVLVEWVCPGDDAGGVRVNPEFTTWINALMAEVAERGRSELGARVSVLGPTDEVCEGGVATGPPTPAKDEAMAREVHVQTPEGGRWVWHTWFGPGLRDLT
jgi:hypothetical protein